MPLSARAVSIESSTKAAAKADRNIALTLPASQAGKALSTYKVPETINFGTRILDTKTIFAAGQREPIRVKRHTTRRQSGTSLISALREPRDAVQVSRTQTAGGRHYQPGTTVYIACRK